MRPISELLIIKGSSCIMTKDTLMPFRILINPWPRPSMPKQNMPQLSGKRRQFQPKRIITMPFRCISPWLLRWIIQRLIWSIYKIEVDILWHIPITIPRNTTKPIVFFVNTLTVWRLRVIHNLIKMRWFVWEIPFLPKRIMTKPWNITTKLFQPIKPMLIMQPIKKV